MRAPSDRRGDDKIVADILKKCGGDAAAVTNVTKPVTNETPEPDLESYVRLLISGVHTLEPYPPLSGYRKANAKYAAAVRRQIEAMQAVIMAPPAGFNFHALFAPEETASLDTLLQEAEARYEFLVSMLTIAHKRCGWMIETQFGEHGNVGYQQERAAIASAELMQRCGLPLAYSSPTSAYRECATLFFEAASGRYGQDLDRACRQMAGVPIRTENEA